MSTDNKGEDKGAERAIAREDKAEEAKPKTGAEGGEKDEVRSQGNSVGTTGSGLTFEFPTRPQLAPKFVSRLNTVDEKGISYSRTC